jgi:hypothetical protein
MDEQQFVQLLQSLLQRKKPARLIEASQLTFLS